MNSAPSFLTVTLNPALDKTLRVDRNLPQETVRAREVIQIAGGKGLNVARALRRLGAEVVALAPLGGHPGAHLADLARAEGIEVAAVPVSGQTRTAFTIWEAAGDTGAGKYWHYLEPGPALLPEELEALRQAFLAALDRCHTVILSGSVPSPEAAALTPWMVRKAREQGLPVALDSFGATQQAALEAGPWLAKPNLFEWQSTLGETLETESHCWTALDRMRRWGIRVGVLSRGAEGALALVDGRRYRIEPAPVAELSDLGGGDSMVAGICWASARGLPSTECLAWGAACGAANAEVWNPGEIDRKRVVELMEQVRVVEL